MMVIREAINILKCMKDYYNDEDQADYMSYDSEENEAVNMAIDALEQKAVKGYMRQQIERNIQYEILEDSKKARASAQLTISIQNFINAMGEIDIQVGIQTQGR